MLDPREYTDHSGGTQGADLMWDKIGREYGVTNHIHWRPEHVSNMTPEGRTQMLDDVQDAAIALGRPYNFKGVELVHRNWFQVHHGKNIYAVSTIVLPGAKDSRGFVNKTKKSIVAGGTGWTVEMGIQKNIPTHVFDMSTNMWYRWYSAVELFLPISTPALMQTFAGIGSRELTEAGVQAIRNVYEKTFKL